MAGAWRPDRLAARRARLAERGRILDATRRYFAAAGFVEVDTPALQISPGLEPHLRAFATMLSDPREAAAKPRFLHTSPEFAMKKLVAGGMQRIWQLAHAFRDGERGATHHPEFAMLEWYRTGASYLDLVADCQALLRAAQTGPLTWQGRTCDASLPFERLSVAEAFHRHAGIDILAAPDLPALAAAAARAGLAAHPGDDWESLYFRIFLDRIEPRLGIGAPTVLYDYPAAMAALARLKPGDPRLAERFELYVCGLELANAFSELTDAAEQRARFGADRARKLALYGGEYPIDEDFLAALEHGMPECAGIALGFDRLVMLATGAAHLEEVLWLPVD